MTQTSKALAEADWDFITVKLLAYAKRKVFRLSWSNAGAVSTKAEDLVYEAINRVLSGERVWAQEKHPDLLIFLYGVVKSIVSHDVKSSHNLRTEKLPDTLERQNSIPKVGPEGQDYIDRLLSSVCGDDDLEELVLHIASGYTKASDLAEQMKMPIQEVYRLRERLQRKIEKIKTGSKKEATL